MSASALSAVVAFVEGRLTSAEFEQSLQRDPTIEQLLVDDPDLPPSTYVGSSVFLYLLQLNLSDPGDVVSAQGAAADWLKRHGIAHSMSSVARDTHAVLLDAQPRWLRVDAKWIQDELLPHSEGRQGKALREWLHAQLVERFRYATSPPSWIQSPVWPIGAGGPMVFLGQLTIDHYFHDSAAAYVFFDPATRECRTILQVA